MEKTNNKLIKAIKAMFIVLYAFTIITVVAACCAVLGFQILQVYYSLHGGQSYNDVVVTKLKQWLKIFLPIITACAAVWMASIFTQFALISKVDKVSGSVVAKNVFIIMIVIAAIVYSWILLVQNDFTAKLPSIMWGLLLAIVAMCVFLSARSMLSNCGIKVANVFGSSLGKFFLYGSFSLMMAIFFFQTFSSFILLIGGLITLGDVEGATKFQQAMTKILVFTNYAFPIACLVICITASVASIDECVSSNSLYGMGQKRFTAVAVCLAISLIAIQLAKWLQVWTNNAVWSNFIPLVQIIPFSFLISFARHY